MSASTSINLAGGVCRNDRRQFSVDHSVSKKPVNRRETRDLLLPSAASTTHLFRFRQYWISANKNKQFGVSQVKILKRVTI